MNDYHKITENNYCRGVACNANPTRTLIPFLTYLWHKHGKFYRNVVADSGYESLTNYRWALENG